MSESADNLVNIQDDVQARLLADAYFSDITVLSERKGNILDDINKSLGTITEKNTKVGACVIVLQPTARVESANVSTPTMHVNLSLRVLEEPVINNGDTGTTKSALSIAREIVNVLHQFISEGIASPLIPSEPTIVPVEDPVAPVAYEVRFSTMEQDATDYLKVGDPSISPREGAVPQTVTITTATSGASIYYTTDGSHPSAVNGEAVLYTVPFVVSVASVIRACAFKSGQYASNVRRAEFT